MMKETLLYTVAIKIADLLIWRRHVNRPSSCSLTLHNEMANTIALQEAGCEPWQCDIRRHQRAMSAPSPATTADLSAWTSAPDWRALLRRNARYIREEVGVAPYPLPCGLRITRAMQDTVLELQAYGILVRYARAEWDSGRNFDPNLGQWVRTQDRAFLHLIWPTEAGIPKARINELLQRLLSDREKPRGHRLRGLEGLPTQLTAA